MIEDYTKTFTPAESNAVKLTCRNPFKMDEDALNYDMDTEDELAEEQGEDLPDEQKSLDDDEELRAEQEEQKGFIVEDDYLSVSEMNYSNKSLDDQDKIREDLELKKVIIQRNRESKDALKNQKDYE